MQSFLLKISWCHLLTYLGRLAQLVLWQLSQVHGKNSLETIIKVSKSGFGLCKVYSSFDLPFSSTAPQLGKEQEKLRRERRGARPTSGGAQRQHRSRKNTRVGMLTA